MDDADADLDDADEDSHEEPKQPAAASFAAAPAGAESHLEDAVQRASDAEGADALEAWAWALELGARLNRPSSDLAAWVVEAVGGQDEALSALQAVFPPLAGRRDVWELVADELTLAVADDTVLAGALYGALFYGLGRLEDASEFAGYAGAPAAAEADAIPLAKKGNWRKAHQALAAAYGGDDVAGYRAQAYLAMGLGKADKATDSLRRVLRADKSDLAAIRFVKVLYRQDEKWGPLADSIKKETAFVDEGDSFRLGLAYRDMVQLYRDRLNQPTNVLAAYKSLVEVDPSDPTVIDEYAALLEELNRPQDLVKVLRMKADASPDAESKVAIHAEVAELFLERFNNQVEGIASYEAVLALDPEHPKALHALDDLYFRRRQWDELIAVKRKLVEITDDDEVRAAKLRDGAEIAATRMRDPELAIELWSEVLEIAPEDPTSLEALERLFERANDYERLAGVLAKRVYVIDDEGERALALMKLGQLQSDRLGDVEASVQTYEDLLEIEPDNFRAKDSLKKAYIDLQRWDQLEEFFRRSGAWPEYVRQLESLAGSLDDAATRVELLFRAADVWNNELEDPARATKALERVLSIEEQNYDAALRLAPVYEERSDFKRLPPLLEVILDREEDPEARFDYQIKLARIASERQRDADRAFRWFGMALDELPHRVEILDEAMSAAGDAGRWEDMEQHLSDARARLSGEPEYQDQWLALSLRLSAVYDSHLGEADAALSCLNGVLDVVGGHAEALDRQDAIFSRQENWDALLEVLDSKLNQADQEEERIALWERVAMVHEDHREDVDSAIIGYQKILGLDPTHLAALQALHRLFRVSGDFHNLCDVLRSLVDLRGARGELDERRQLRLELANALVKELGETAAAVEVLRDVVGETPGDPAARTLLEQLLEEDDDRLAVARILEPLYESEGAWPKLVDDLEIQLTFADGDRAVSTELLARIGEILADCVGDMSASADAYSRLLRLVPADADAQRRLEFMASETGEWHHVVDLYESLMEQLDPNIDDERGLAVELGTRAAAFYDLRIGDAEEAIRLHRRVLDFDPTRVETLVTLDELYTRSEQWGALLGAIEERLQLTDGASDRRALHFKAASIHEEQLEDHSAAIDEYRRVLDLVEDDLEALEALDRLYITTSDSASRAEVIERRVQLADDGGVEQLMLKNRLASLYEDELGEVPRAMEVWREVLDVEPTDTDAVRGLETQLETEDYAMAASAILEPLYVAQGAPTQLARLLEIRLLHVHDLEERRSLYHRIAGLHEDDLEDRTSAYHALTRAAEEFLDDNSIIDRLYRLAGVLGNYSELGDTLEELALDAPDPSVRRDTLVRVARIREDRVGDVEAAAELWRQVLEDSPTDREALDALERIDETMEKWEELVEITLRKAELPDVAADLAQFKPLMFRAALIHEEMLGQPDESIEVLRQLLSADPVDRNAINQLETLYTRTARWEDLVDNYNRKLELAESDDERRDLLMTLGPVLETELDDPDRAIGAYRSILDIDPTDLQALQSLDRLYLATEAWYDLLGILRSQVDLVDSEEQRRNTLYRIGKLQESELTDFQAAVDVYRSILDEDSTHASTRAALQSMITRGDEAQSAARILEPIYRSEGLWHDLVSINRTLIDSAETATTRRDLHVDIAQIMERELADAHGAIAAYSKAAQEELRTSELDELERLASDIGAWQPIGGLFVELWDEVSEPGLRANIALRVARIRETELEDVSGSISAYARLHEEDPSNQDALESLDRLYASTSQWESLADIVQKRIFLGGAENDGTALRLRLGKLYHQFLDESAEAVSVYREVLEADPRNSDATAALEQMIRAGVESYDIAMILDPLYRNHEEWQNLVDLNETRTHTEVSADERFQILLDSASIQEEKLGQRVDALNTLGNALFEQPADDGLKDRIEALGAEEDENLLVAEVYGMLLEQPELGDNERLDIALRLARVHQGRLSDDASAERAFVTALEVEPGCVEALQALDGMYTAQERWEELVVVVGRLREAIYDQNAMVSLAFRHAELYRDRVGRSETAISTFNEVLELDPSHGEALSALVALYTESEQWEELFDTHERQSLLTNDQADRADVAVKMATLATEKLDRPMDAIDLWQSVLAFRAEDRQALANLAYLYERTEQYNDLADILDRQIQLEDDPEAKVGLLRRAGHMWGEFLDNPDQAVARYNSVLDHLPGDPGALRALRGLYELVGDYERLVDVLRQLLSIGDIPEEDEAGVYQQLGTIFADTLMRSADAIDAWKQVARRRPTELEALDRLEALYTQDAQWENAVGVIEQKAELAGDPDERIELIKRVATVWSQRLSNLDNAARAYERVREVDATDFDATSALEQIYTQTEDWESLAGLCVSRLDTTDDPWDRLQLLRQAADIYESRLENAEGAFHIIGVAARENPADEEVRAELERLAVAADMNADLVKTYRAMISTLEASEGDESESILALMLEVGNVFDSRLGQADEAEAAYDRALTLDPECEPALAALESIYLRGESWVSLIGVLRRRVNLAFDTREQASLHKRIGRLFEERLDDPTEAVEAYKMAVRLDESDREALDSLERIYAEGQEWRELVDVLERKADTSFEPADQIALHSRIGELWADRLGVPERAVEAYRAVIDHDPANKPALQALERLFAHLEKWDRYLETVESQLMQAVDDAERIDLYARQALVYEQHFDDVDAAVNAHFAILDIDARDLEAITSLERIFIDQERIHDLVDVLERHVRAVEEPEMKTGVLCEIAKVQVEHLDDSYSAIETYRRVVEIEAYHPEALASIGSLYEVVEQPAAAVQAYKRLAQVTGEPNAKLKLILRCGKLLESPIGELEDAAAHYRQCIEIDESCTEAMEALERVHTTREEWPAALDMLQAQIEFARDLKARSNLMVRQARIHGDKLGDVAQAQVFYEEAIELNPLNIDAAVPLSGLFFEQSDWVRARPLIELQRGTSMERTEEEETLLLYRAGVVAHHLGFEAEAVQHYESTLQINPGHLGALRGLAALYTRLGRADDAYNTYVDILAGHRGAMDPAEAVDCYFKAGEIKVAQDDGDTARQMFLNALEIQPEHEPSLRNLLRILESEDDKHSLVDVKQRLLSFAVDDLEKFKLLVEIGDSYLELSDPSKAEQTYREAVKVDPNSKVVLHKLLNIFTGTGNWRRATEVLGQLARMEENSERLAKLCFTIAAIFRDELGEMEQAVQFFNQALDAKFDYLEAFEAIDHLLTSARDWRALEQNYRRMVARVEAEGGAGSVDLKVTLLKNLGEIYRSRLENYDDAIAAYQLASSLSPNDEVLITILAELMQLSGRSSDDIVEQHQRLIAVSPFRIESYRAIFQNFVQLERFDEAWCVSAALCLLQQAKPEEEQYYTRYLPPNVRQAKHEFSQQAWRERIYHPDLDRNITALFELLGTHLRPQIRREVKEWGLHKRKDRIELDEQTPLTKMTQYAMSRVGVAALNLYEKPDHMGLTNMNVDPPALVVGRDMLGGKSQRELAFQVAKAITLMRPEFYLASALPSTDYLKTFFLAATSVVTKQVQGENRDQIVSYAHEIEDLPAPVVEQIKRAVVAIFDSGRNPDMSAWLRAVDHTSNRSGLLLSGDLRTAVACMKVEFEAGRAISKADMKERVRELILFNISNDYFELRRSLGLALAKK